MSADMHFVDWLQASGPMMTHALTVKLHFILN